jgi:hypothetical protein
MPITLHADPPLAPKSELCLSIVRQALIEEVTRFEFRRGTEAPKAFALVLQDDDASRALVYGSVCRFLRREWPGAMAAH